MPARVLVIEDNAANLELMIYLLEAFGHTTIGVRDGREGIDTALRELPDLILCDIQLPGADGYEVAASLRDNQRTSRIPRVAITAFAMAGDRERVLSAGFNGYIPKPIYPRTFMAEINTFLPKAAQGAAPVAHSDQTAAAPPVKSSRGTVLLVDNTPANLEFGRAVLEPAGFNVITCCSPSDAVALARVSRPRVIISDLDMPSTRNGLALMQAVKTDSALKSIPFVFLSSTSPVLASESQSMCEQLGCSKFLVRPIEPGVLLNEIDAVLGPPI